MISYDSQFVKPFLQNIYFLFYVDKLPKLWCTDMNSLRLKTLQQDPYCRLWNCNFYIIFSAVGGSFGIIPAEPSAVLFSLHNVIRPKYAKCCTFRKVFLFFQKIFRAAWSVVRSAGMSAPESAVTSARMTTFLSVLRPASISIFGSAVLSAGIATLKSTTPADVRGRRGARRCARKKGLPHERQPFSDSSKQCKFSEAELI